MGSLFAIHPSNWSDHPARSPSLGHSHLIWPKLNRKYLVQPPTIHQYSQLGNVMGALNS